MAHEIMSPSKPMDSQGKPGITRALKVEETRGNHRRNGKMQVRWFEGWVGKFYDHRLLQEVKDGPIPKHVAIIMDGNRRFALSMAIDKNKGHSLGKEKVRQVMRWSRDLGVRYLTVYALSTENLSRRSQEELDHLFDLYEIGFMELAQDEEIHRDKVRCQAVGQLHLLPERVIKAIHAAEEMTKAYDSMIFTVCLAYGGRQELVDAIQAMMADHTNGKIRPDDVTEELVSQYLYTKEMPDPDLLIRTSGEERSSNFLLWQMAYSEMLFIDVFWPAFRKRDYLRGIRTYQGRKRRYGQ